jgi:N-acetylmuramoyl-L-alanine amidase
MKSVYLSPSTQEKNIGVNGYGTEEVYCNHIADLMEARLKERGIAVYRNKPTMTLKEAVADSDAKKPDLHLAIHTNAMGGASAGKAQGCEVFLHRRHSPSESFAQRIFKAISEMTPWKDRGVKEGHDYFGLGKHLYETGYTDAPAALVELDFHDNGESVMWLMKNAPSLAAALCLAIEDEFDIPRIPTIDQHVISINNKLTAAGQQPLAMEYWQTHAVAGQTCDGAYVAAAFSRIANIP